MMIHSMDEVCEKIRLLEFKESFDRIIAIANGGIVPSALLSQKLGLPVSLLRISFRDPEQRPMFDAPRSMEPLNISVQGKNVLVVEDRVKTGATLKLAVQLLSDAKLVKTFAVNGDADYSLFNESCFRFPWIL